MGGGFVRYGVLGDELSADGEVEDGLAELLELSGAGGEAREDAADEELGVTRSVASMICAPCSNDDGLTPRVVPAALPLGLRSLQPITQRHQFIDLGDDAALFGEGVESAGIGSSCFFDRLCTTMSIRSHFLTSDCPHEVSDQTSQ